ncbi:arrestin-N domain-containing protein [Favolaschia claudopus]|uniref:Arrestin-N domain-containing protein n=1 Tax=Favolaschia claudopus TaxID=2862362 RepID=A0AAW0BCU3_9AGAR
MKIGVRACRSYKLRRPSPVACCFLTFPDHLMSPQAVSLVFENRVRICGEFIQGHVELNVPLALEDDIEAVRVKLRGSIYVEITEHRSSTDSHGRHRSSTDTQRRRTEVLRADASLWTPGGSQNGQLILPFQFHLPPNLPPSFHCTMTDGKGIISYGIEVVADRPGIFKRNRRIASVFSVVPAANPQDLATQHLLLQGWSGQWQSIDYEQRMRRGLWGEYSHVKTKLVYPGLAAFPMSTPLPFQIHITIDTKPMKRTDSPFEDGKPLFPVPPSNFSELSLTLIRNVHLHAYTRRKNKSEMVLYLGGTGEATHSSSHSLDMDPPEWIPVDGDKGKGIWRRTVHMQSTLCLSVPPTHTSQYISWDYALQLSVPFKGIGNDVDTSSPIWIVPAFACPPSQPFSTGHNPELTYADVPPPFPVPSLDLPPAYYEGEHHGWEDEKQ